MYSAVRAGIDSIVVGWIVTAVAGVWSVKGRKKMSALLKH